MQIIVSYENHNKVILSEKTATQLNSKLLSFDCNHEDMYIIA